MYFNGNSELFSGDSLDINIIPVLFIAWVSFLSQTLVSASKSATWTFINSNTLFEIKMHVVFVDCGDFGLFLFLFVYEPWLMGYWIKLTFQLFVLAWF